MAARLFGTDGIRGVFGEPPLDRRTVTVVGTELGRHLRRGSSSATVLLGGDTRESTPTLCSWLTEGLASAGTGAVLVGTAPTPAVAYLTRSLGCTAGVAVSASHNQHPDNGLKLFDAAGSKWRPDQEQELERKISAALATSPAPRGTETAATRETSESTDGQGSSGLERPTVLAEHLEKYLDSLRATVPTDALSGLRITLDMANGAATPFGRRLFFELGAEVTLLGDCPDGKNINQHCGSTHPDAMARRTVESGSHLGFAFDGDADRVIVADEKGTIRDGDALLYLLARDLQDRGSLDPPRIVATSMSNLGLEVALARHGIEMERCDVGDREVVATLRRHGLTLGGEQSGHIIQLNCSTTGDGLLTALMTAQIVARNGTALSEHLREFERYPQVLVNVRVREKPALLSLPTVAAAAIEVEDRLGARGRLVLRYSGTEPLARVMIEGPELSEIQELAKHLTDAIDAEIGERETG
ncbi:MAG: phosphoglucosamine mutase [Acidobacteriota bacterium]|nr:phosphoglucosamine mutase [Acidobacteriota bacterium]